MWAFLLRWSKIGALATGFLSLHSGSQMDSNPFFHMAYFFLGVGERGEDPVDALSMTLQAGFAWTLPSLLVY